MTDQNLLYDKLFIKIPGLSSSAKVDCVIIAIPLKYMQLQIFQTFLDELYPKF